MRAKRFLAGLLTVAMIGASLATPGNTLQTEAAAKPLQKISITKKATVYVGAKKQLKITKAPKNTTAKITWKSSNKKVATVTSKGVVKGIKAGSATITASGKGEKNKTLKATCKVTVKKRLITKLKTNFTKATLEVGKAKTIKTTITPKNASIKTLKYKSSNTKVATVTSKGKITAKKAGNATITVSATDGSKKKVSIKVTVKAKATPQVKVSKVTADNSEFTLEAGTKQKMNITVAPSNATNKTLKYASSDPYAATVSSDGTITALAQGSTDITIEAADGGGAKAKVHVTVVDTDKPRAVITQDGEVDDQNSMIHLLLYGNEIDIQGIIQTSSQFHWIGDPNATYTEEGRDFKNPYRWPGTDWMMEMADDYEAVYGNLRTHDSAYPTPNYIRSVIKIGNIAYKGDMREETEGSKLVEEAFLDDDPRTLYLMAWGGTNTIGRALMSIEEKYKNTDQWAAIRKKIIDKTVIGAYGTQDQTYSEYIGEEWPEIMFVEVSGTSYGYAWSRTAGSVDSEAKRTLSSAWMRENLDYGHGPLLDRYVTWGDGTYLPGEEEGSQFGTNENLVDSTDWWGGRFIGKYQRYDFLSEGDSPSFFYLMDTGLRSLESDMANGSFAGRYQKIARQNSKGEAENWYSVARDYDAQQERLVSSDWRFMADIQHQFAIRADWCITPKYEDANHTPSLTVKEGLDFTAKPGEALTLHAEADDPDGDYVTISWEHYFEADTYQEPEENKGIYIKGAKSDTATITVPQDAKDGDTLIINVKAEDNGTHSLARYQQVIITVSENGISRPSSIAASVEANTLVAGNTAQITVTPQPASADMPALVYESSDPLAATVSNDGIVTAVAQGSTKITVKSVQGNLEASIDISVDYDREKVDKPRVIITNDGEIDDKNSYVHMLYYANEIDLVGLVQTSSFAHWAGSPNAPDSADSMGQSGKKPWAWPGTEWQNQFIDAYAEIYPNLKVHDPNYPTPNYLKSVVRIGNIGYKGDMDEDTAGSNLIKELILDDVEGPLFITAWGGLNTASKALLSIYEQYGSTAEWDSIRQKIYDKVRIYMWGGQDDTYDDVVAVYYPELICMDVCKSQALGWGWEAANTNKKHAIPEEMSGSWLRKNIDSGHGALLDWYVTFGDGTHVEGENAMFQFGENDDLLNGTVVAPGCKRNRYDFCGEGDTPTYLSFFDTGLRSLEQYEWGSIVGRFKKEEGKTNKNGVAITNYYVPENDYVDLGYGMDSYDSGARWVPYIMREFAARADWGITPNYEDANHRPDISIKEGLDIEAAPGQRVSLNAETSDPDGDKVSVQWFHYMEAGTYKSSQDEDPSKPSAIAISGGGNNDRISFTVPEDAKEGDTIHMIAKATDDGEHNLSYYQRVIVTVKGVTKPESITVSGNASVETGKNISLTAAVLPEAATVKTVTWTSSDESIATVNGNGQVTGVSAGTVTITAISKADKEVKGSIEITVTRAANDPANSKVRTIVTTDGEVDDMDSFMRLMLYANEMDIAGLILSSSTYHYAGDPEKGIEPYRWTGTQWAYDVLDDYAEVYDNLKIHADGYPTPAYLKSILKIGNIKNVGEMEEITEGSEFMKDILLDDDERTLYIQTWGGTNTTARALKSIQEEYGNTDQWDAIYKKVCDKAVIYIILNQDDTFSNYIKVNWPDIKTIHDGGTFWRFAYMWKQVPAELTTKLSGSWFYKNILKNHGPLLANYKTMGDGTTLEGELDNEQRGWENRIGGTTGYERYDFISEGDSPSFFYLLDTGLRSLEDPTYGGWGGRFGYGNPDNPSEGTYENNVADHNTITDRDDTTFTLTRWFDDIQNDFGARADWCVADSYEKANHRPTAEVVTGLDVTGAPGQEVTMSVKASDPDGDSLTYKWWQYYEADTYNGKQDGKISLKGAASDRLSFTVPADAKAGDTIHMVVEVYDDGAHNMKHYQRVILTVEGESIPVSKVEVTANNTTIVAGATATVTAAVTPANATDASLEWSSDDESVATVASGRRGYTVTGISAGKTTIRATSSSNPEVSGSIEITVTRAANDPANSKVRTIVTTDGEVDDMDSFMRLMLYANEMDIAGLILSSSTYHYAGDPEKGIEPYRWTGTQWAYDVLDDYAEVYDNLKIHADGYPTPAYLKSILKIGNIKNVGEMEEITEGSEFMKDILLDDDERTLYIQTWGGTNTTARALKSIQEEYGDTDQWDAIYKKVCDKAVIYIILNQDDTFSNYIKVNWPDIKTIHDGGTFWRFAYMWKSVPAELTTKLSGSWFYKNILKNHGPLLANYKTMGDGTTLEGELDNEQRGWENRIGGTTGYERYDFISEGDSPSFFYLLDTGLRSLEDPTYGGWGGRFGYGNPDNPSEGTYENNVADHNTITDRDDTTFTLTRWFDDIQNDFGARADWCVADSYEKANHRPTAVVTTGLDVTAYPGENVMINVNATDPDGDSLSYKWWQYYEADTYNGSQDGQITMKGAASDKMSFTVPEDAKNGDTIHMVVEVFDDGAHNMKHYQRVIITVAGREELGALTLSLPEDVQNNQITFGAPTSGWGGPSYSRYAKQLTVLSDGAAVPTGKTFTWESSDTTVATVNASGLVTPAGNAGTATITATANDGSGKAVTIEVTLVDTRTAAASESAEEAQEAADSKEAEQAEPQAEAETEGPQAEESQDGAAESQAEDQQPEEEAQPESDAAEEIPSEGEEAE